MYKIIVILTPPLQYMDYVQLLQYSSRALFLLGLNYIKISSALHTHTHTRWSHYAVLCYLLIVMDMHVLHTIKQLIIRLVSPKLHKGCFRLALETSMEKNSKRRLLTLLLHRQGLTLGLCPSTLTFSQAT